MNRCDCSFWGISWFSYSSLVFCILGVWGLLLAYCLTGQILRSSALGLQRRDPQWSLVGVQGAQDP